MCTAPRYACRKRDGAKADLLDYGMPTKRKGGATGASVLDLDTAGNYRPRTKVGRHCQHISSQPVRQRGGGSSAVVVQLHPVACNSRAAVYTLCVPIACMHSHIHWMPERMPLRWCCAGPSCRRRGLLMRP